MANDYHEKDYDDEVYEDGYYEEHYEEEELADESELIEEEEELDRGEEEAEVESRGRGGSRARRGSAGTMRTQKKVTVSYACEECDYRWDDIIIKKKGVIEEEEPDVICPMCGSMNVTLI